MEYTKNRRGKSTELLKVEIERKLKKDEAKEVFRYFCLFYLKTASAFLYVFFFSLILLLPLNCIHFTKFIVLISITFSFSRSFRAVKVENCSFDVLANQVWQRSRFPSSNLSNSMIILIKSHWIDDRKEWETKRGSEREREKCALAYTLLNWFEHVCLSVLRINYSVCIGENFNWIELERSRVYIRHFCLSILQWDNTK